MEFTPLSLEAKRACFRAQVMAIEAGQQHVTPDLLLAALFVSPEIVESCERAGFSVDDLMAVFELAEPIRRLDDANASLAAANIPFGSRQHIDSLESVRRPLADDLLQVFLDLNHSLMSAGRRMTVFDVLEAIAGTNGPFSEKAKAIGWSVSSLRASGDSGERH
jgi:hypothetical protein